MICIIDSENVSAQWACALRACIEPFVLKGGERGEREIIISIQSYEDCISIAFLQTSIYSKGHIKPKEHSRRLEVSPHTKQAAWNFFLQVLQTIFGME